MDYIPSLYESTLNITDLHRIDSLYFLLYLIQRGNIVHVLAAPEAEVVEEAVAVAVEPATVSKKQYHRHT